MMSNHQASLAGVLCLLLAACGDAPQPEPVTTEGTPVSALGEDSVAITNVTVIDVASGEQASGVTVVTIADQIVSVGPGTPVPIDSVEVDGTGKYLIPGLWDMHAHHQAVGLESVDLFVANGVVGTRDMGADLEFILPLRDRVSRGELLGPEIVIAGPVLDDAPPDWPIRRSVTSADDAREAVVDLGREGVDFLKVHNQTPPEAFFAIAEEGARMGLPFAGHVPIGVSVVEAATSGIRSIEHLAGYRVFQECSGDSEYGLDGCLELFGVLAANDVWQTPTMAFLQSAPEMFAGEPLAHREYASDTFLEIIRESFEEAEFPEEELESMRSNARTGLVVVRDLFATGSGILAGCDGLVPGFCLHDELEWLAQAGLSPLEVLRAATLNAARFLGREDSQGTIEVGKRADLVLLDANPLLDIANTRSIAAVLVRGRFLSKTDIDAILASHRRVSAP